MRRGLSTETPLPTRLVSNEEFPPLPQTPAQRQVEERILADAARLTPRLGLNRRDFLYVAWWLAAFPGAALALTALGVNLLGDWLRDTLDPKLSV